MPTFMRHPEHGTKVADTAPEIAFDKSKGWEEFDPFLRVEEEKKKEAPVSNKQEDALKKILGTK